MKSSAKKIELASVDDLFSTEESRQDEQLEKIQEIPLSELHPFKDHPFKVKDDDAMIETADSIKKYGVLVPAIARPLPDGGYELVAGHRRRRASELAGKETMPVIVRDLDDDAATIIMVDSNLQLGIDLSANLIDSLQELLQTFSWKILCLDGDYNPISGSQCIDRKHTQGGLAINKDMGVLPLQRVQILPQDSLTAHGIYQGYLHTG